MIVGFRIVQTQSAVTGRCKVGTPLRHWPSPLAVLGSGRGSKVDWGIAQQRGKQKNTYPPTQLTWKCNKALSKRKVVFLQLVGGYLKQPGLWAEGDITFNTMLCESVLTFAQATASQTEVSALYCAVHVMSPTPVYMLLSSKRRYSAQEA